MLRGRILTAEQVPNGNGPESVPRSALQSNPPVATCPPTVDALQAQIHQRLDEIIAYCSDEPDPVSFLEFETALRGLLRSLGCLLIQLFLRARHDRLDPADWK